MRACRWCPAGTHLILYGYYGWDGAHRCSTYNGFELLNTFTLASSCILLEVSPEAAVLHFACDERRPGIHIFARNGRQLAQHLPNRRLVPVHGCTSSWQDGSLLAISETGDTLYVCSPAGHLQAISLARPAAQARHFLHGGSKYDALVAVCIIGQQSEVVLVDLAKQHVTCRHALRSVPIQAIDYVNSINLAQCSRGLAFCYNSLGKAAGTRVILNSGTELFVVPDACSPSWDLLGSFLAVKTPTGVSVYSFAGACLATVNGLPTAQPWALPQVHWLPESSELSVWGPSDSALVLLCRFH